MHLDKKKYWNFLQKLESGCDMDCRVSCNLFGFMILLLAAVMHSILMLHVTFSS